jgi:hypothetical protein
MEKHHRKTNRKRDQPDEKEQRTVVHHLGRPSRQKASGAKRSPTKAQGQTGQLNG